MTSPAKRSFLPLAPNPKWQARHPRFIREMPSARRIAALADAHRIALAPHNPQGPVSTAASLEFGFSQPSYIICESVHNDVPWREDVV